jgi:hypothetical protein
VRLPHETAYLSRGRRRTRQAARSAPIHETPSAVSAATRSIPRATALSFRARLRQTKATTLAIHLSVTLCNQKRSRALTNSLKGPSLPAAISIKQVQQVSDVLQYLEYILRKQPRLRCAVYRRVA